jgi:hypothetical protein
MKTQLKLFSNYIFNILIALDELLNAICGGEPDETLTFRLAKDREQGSVVGCVLCKFLDIFEKDHCTKSVERNRSKGNYER